MQKKPVLIYTDDGRDVDDVEAIAYLAGSPNIDIVGVVTTHMIPDRRAFIARSILNALHKPHVPIGVGSVFPIGKEDMSLVNYLREHTIDNVTYEGSGLIECFSDGVDLIHETIEKYGANLSIAALAPLTDLAKAISVDESNFAKVGGIYIQGQASVDRNRLIPDIAAYNLKEDEAASDIVFSLQDRVPFTLVGKHSAYQVPFTKNDFASFAKTKNAVGTYLETHAKKGLECFAKRDPVVFERVFGVPSSEVSSLENLSNPYDALVAKSLANPADLHFETVGNHQLLGMTKEYSGITNPVVVKLDLITTILSALNG